MKRRVKAGDLKQLRGALAERFDQFNFNGQMVRIVRADAMHLIQHFLRDTLGLVVVHACTTRPSHSLHRFEAGPLCQPIDQESRRGPVIGGRDAATLLLIPNRIVKSRRPAGQADAINRSP